MHTFLIEMLLCPACHSELSWEITQQSASRIESAEARCRGCSATYPVRKGIGLFLTPDLPRNDLWEQVDSQLIQYMHEHPESERQLLDLSLEELSPADQHIRGQILEAAGDFAQAKIAIDTANQGLYTAEYLACLHDQLNYVVEQLTSSEGPVVDLASGQGGLVEPMARRLDRPIVATDFSPNVLRRDRRWLKSLNLYDTVSLLAFDARRTPFKDGTIGTMTTLLGLPNIEQPGALLKELRRVVCGKLIAICFFAPEDDAANIAPLREMGVDTMLVRSSTVESFRQAGWQVELSNLCRSRALPTPPSAVIEGFVIDGFPMSETTLEWCVLVAQ
jgi:uncharacterized protein YbaR (Trm112 family)